MPNLDNTPTNEEIVAALNTVIAKSGVDSFKLKIFRRQGFQHVMKHVATLGQAQLAHVMNAENWLPQLGGGGPQYVMECFHGTEPSSYIKGRLVFLIDGQEAAPNPNVVNDPAWQGPRQWIGPGTIIGSQGTQQAYSALSPAAPPVGGLHGQTHAPNATQPGISYDPRVDAMLTRLEIKERELEQQKQQQAIADAERRAAEREREAERKIEAMRQETQRQLDSLKAALTTPQKSNVAELATAFTPILTAWMDQQKAEREERRRQDAIDREERNRRYEAEQARNQLFLTKLLEPKPLIDPAVEKLMARREDPGAMADAFSKMTGTTMKMMSIAMNSMRDQDPENPAIQILTEVRHGLESMFSAMQGPQPVLQVMNEPAPQTQQAPAGAVATAPQTPTTAKPTGANTPIQAPPNTLLHNIIDRVRRLEDTKKLASDFFDALDEDAKDDSVKKALLAAKGDAVKLFSVYVGDEWAKQNQTYALTLGRDMQDEYKKRQEEEAQLVEEQGEEEAQEEA